MIEEKKRLLLSKEGTFMSSPEKRKHSRWNINPGYPCRIQSGGTTIDGRLIDLSAMGAYVESDAPPSVGSQLSIDVD